MLKISKMLFTSWNDNQLCYCHWKSNEHLLPGLMGDTDLDVLLSEKDKEHGEEVLRKLDFLQCRSQYGSRYPGVDDWIGFDENTGKLIHLHLHYHVITGHKGLKEYNIPWTSEVLETRIQDSVTGVFIASPSIELVTLYTRIALKVSLSDLCKRFIGKYHIDKSFLIEIEYLKRRVDWNDVEKMVFRYYDCYASQVVSIMKKDVLTTNDIFILRRIAERIFRKVSRYKYSNRLLEFYYKYALKFRKFLRLKLHRFVVTRKVPKSGKGVQVAFLGQDGAGKTTVTTIIRKWWSWKMDVQLVYLGSGENYHSWRKILLNKLPRSYGFKIVRAWLTLSKYKKLAKDVLHTIKEGDRYAKKGGLVIYDRYPQIQYSGISDGPKIRKLFLEKSPELFRGIFSRYAKIEEKYLKQATEHQPDIVFKLMIPPEESVRRKPENALDTMVTKHNIIKSLQFEKSDVYVIDATMPFEEEILMIKKIIWEHVQK